MDLFSGMALAVKALAVFEDGENQKTNHRTKPMCEMYKRCVVLNKRDGAVVVLVGSVGGGWVEGTSVSRTSLDSLSSWGNVRPTRKEVTSPSRLYTHVRLGRHRLPPGSSPRSTSFVPSLWCLVIQFFYLLPYLIATCIDISKALINIPSSLQSFPCTVSQFAEDRFD